MSTLYDALDFSQAFEEAPVVENNSARMPDGKKIVLVIPTPKLDAAGAVELFPLRSKKVDAPAVKVPQIALNLLILEHLDSGEKSYPVVELKAVLDDKNNILEIAPVFPEKLQGFIHVEFMNDDNLDMQWRKNILRDALDFATPSKHLDYSKLLGAILEVDIKTSEYIPTTGKNANKKQYNQNIVFNKDSINKAAITINIAEKNGKPVEFSEMFMALKPENALNIFAAYKEKKAAYNAAKEKRNDTEEVNYDAQSADSNTPDESVPNDLPF